MYINTLDLAASAALIARDYATATPTHHERGLFLSDPDSESPIKRWSSFIGIVTAICGNILISFALNIQRYAHIRIGKELDEKKQQSRKALRRARSYGTTQSTLVLCNNGDGKRNEIGRSESDPMLSSCSSHDTTDSEEQHEKRSYLHSPYWWGGIILMTIGETGNFLAYAFAPASIVSPLGVVALISNCVIAPIMLKEKFRMRDFWGVLVAIGGAVTVVLSAKQQEKRLGPHEVLGAITTLEFEIYMAVTAVLIGTLIWLSPRYGHKTILIDLGLVGLFGGYTALSTKGVASMLTDGFVRALATPITYALLAVLAGTAVMQIKYVNKALQRFDSTQVIPVQFVLFTLSVIIGSAVLYRDFEHTTLERTIKFVCGCLLTFFGVFLITSGRPGQSTLDDSDSGDEEQYGLQTQQHDSADYVPYNEAPKYPPMEPSPLHQEFHLDTDTDSLSEFPDLSRRTSRVCWAVQSFETPSKHLSKAPSLRLTTPASIPNEESPLIDFDNTSPAAVRPLLSRLASQNAANGQAQSDSALAGAQQPTTPGRAKSMLPLPGPFISPLSSSLSVVVADTLRRGTDVYGTRKRPRMSLTRLTSGAVDGSDDERDERCRSRSRPSTRPGSPPRKRGAMARRDSAHQALSRSLDNGRPLSGGRPRAKSLGHKLSEFFSLARGLKSMDVEARLAERLVPRSSEGNGDGMRTLSIENVRDAADGNTERRDGGNENGRTNSAGGATYAEVVQEGGDNGNEVGEATYAEVVREGKSDVNAAGEASYADAARP